MRSESLAVIILVRSWVSFSLLCRRRGMKILFCIIHHWGGSGAGKDALHKKDWTRDSVFMFITWTMFCIFGSFICHVLCCFIILIYMEHTNIFFFHITLHRPELRPIWPVTLFSSFTASMSEKHTASISVNTGFPCPQYLSVSPC